MLHLGHFWVHLHGFCEWAILTNSKQNHADIAHMILILLFLVTKGLRGHWRQSQNTLFPKYCIFRLFLFRRVHSLLARYKGKQGDVHSLNIRKLLAC